MGDWNRTSGERGYAAASSRRGERPFRGERAGRAVRLLLGRAACWCALLVACGGRSAPGISGTQSATSGSGGSLGADGKEGGKPEPQGGGGTPPMIGSGGDLPSGGVEASGGSFADGGSGATGGSGGSPADGGSGATGGSGGNTHSGGGSGSSASSGGSGGLAEFPCGGCEGKQICDEGTQSCVCDDGWEGPFCDHRWNPVTVPPFAQALRFDSAGNAWFNTTKGLLYWNLEGTPESTVDDSFALFSDLTTRPGLAIDSADRLWFLSANKVLRLDVAGTPGDHSDDEMLESEVPVGFFDSLLHIAIDHRDRPWTIARAAKGVFVLENPSDLPTDRAASDDAASDAPRWVHVFPGMRVLSLAPEGDGVWLQAEQGLSYVDLGGTLSDSADDTWIHFDDVPLISDQTVTGIFVGEDGTKWFNTERSIVTLTDAGAPLEKSGHAWASWTPAPAALAFGDGPLMALGPDGVPWLAMPFGSAVRSSPVDGGVATEYAPADCPLYPPTDQPGVSAIGQHGAHQFWVTADDNGYLFLGGDTPNDPSDDLWFATRTHPHQHFGRSYPEPTGGRWVMTRGRTQGPDTCSSLLYYSRLEDPFNAWDDEWTLALPFDGDPDCFGLAGVDAQQQVWVNFSWKFGYYATWGLAGPSFFSGGREDALVTYTRESDEMVDGPISFSLGGERPVFGGRPFSSGASLTDKSDDEWGPSQEASLGRLDSHGYSWFVSGSADAPAPLRRLDDGGTPQDLSDDEWLYFFGSEDLPITLATSLWIDNHDWKWLYGVVDDDFNIISFNDGGTPHDSSDDEWRSYARFAVTYGQFGEFENASTSDLWVATDSDFGILELKR